MELINLSQNRPVRYQIYSVLRQKLTDSVARFVTAVCVATSRARVAPRPARSTRTTSHQSTGDRIGGAGRASGESNDLRSLASELRLHVKTDAARQALKGCWAGLQGRRHQWGRLVGTNLAAQTASSLPTFTSGRKHNAISQQKPGQILQY